LVSPSKAKPGQQVCRRYGTDVISRGVQVRSRALPNAYDIGLMTMLALDVRQANEVGIVEMHCIRWFFK
jgi:hypothetical protein